MIALLARCRSRSIPFRAVSKHVLDRKRVELVLAGNASGAQLPQSTMTLDEVVYASWIARLEADNPSLYPDPREWVVGSGHCICALAPPPSVGRDLVMALPPAEYSGAFGKQRVVFYRWGPDRRVWGFDVAHGFAHIVQGNRGNETDAVLLTCALVAPAEQLLTLGSTEVARRQRHAPPWVAPAFEQALAVAVPRTLWVRK